ncbi:MAG: CAP domain-containing protein [Actinomycetota bacterium]|nr:CAP domain-containing protein [Actinomycetota bacterium]
MSAHAFRRPVGLLVLLGSLVAGLTVAAPAHQAAAAFSWNGTAGRVNGYEAALLSYVNGARSATGRAPLTLVPGTTDVARRWSATMAGASVLAHNPSMVANIAAAGSAGWTVMAENVGYGSACNPKQLFDAYMASAHHKANILDPAMRYIGMGVYMRPASGWPCGRAWNTMNFVNSYSSGYGASRNPPQGLPIDSYVITSTHSLGAFETGGDTRAVTGISGSGLYSSGALFDAPSTADNAMHWSVAQTSPLAGWGSLYLRDALDLRNVTQIRVTLQAVTPTGRPLPISLTVAQDWGATATLGTVNADAVPRTFTFTVPAGVRGFDNILRLTMANTSLSLVSSLLAQRKAYVSVYAIDAVV